MVILYLIIFTGVFNWMPVLQTLRIHHNKIDFIESQAFANLTALKKIYASYNYLEYWNSDWFYNSTNLEILDFQRNIFKIIPRLAFASLNQLKIINFNYNEIETIRPGAFQGLTYLQYLGLKNNRLKEINANIFSNNLKIKSFQIGANYLNFLSTDLLNKISVAETILDFNPWICSCMNQIHSWIRSNNGTLFITKGCGDASIPVCAISKQSQTCAEYIDDDLTQRYLNTLKNLSHKFGKGCARID